MRLVQSQGDGDSVQVPPAVETDASGNEVRFWKCYTECSLPIPFEQPKDRVTIRCHPNYHNEGPFYDWCVCRFSSPGYEPSETARSSVENPNVTHYTQFPSDCVPAKVVLFVRHPATDKIYALVHACDYRDLDLTKADSVLLEKWRLEFGTVTIDKKKVTVPTLRFVELESIEARCLVIEEVPGLKEQLDEPPPPHHDQVWLVRTRGEWASKFI